MTKKIDYNLDKAEILQLSNDAYFCLAHGEPCLDEDNYEEVQEFKARFKYGYKFDKQYGIDSVENSDMIECKVIPMCECDTPFTHYRLYGRHCKSEFYYSHDGKQAYYRFYNRYLNRVCDYGWNDVIVSKRGKPEIRPGNCIIPLWGKNWLRY